MEAGVSASATIISTDGFAEIGNFSLGTDGRGGNNLIVRSGAFKQRKVVDHLRFDENGAPLSSDFLYMNGGEIFNFTIDAVPPLIIDALTKNALTKNDIQMFIFHQANKYMLNFLRKKLKIDEEHFYFFMDNVGNTVSSTLPITLNEACRENALTGNVLIAGFGVGYSWGATILKF